MESSYLFDFAGDCPCGKKHTTSVREGIIRKGALGELTRCVSSFGAKRVFLLADVNTYPLAGERICDMLLHAGISVSSYVFSSRHLEPDEAAVGSAVMNYDFSSDLLIVLGSGVLNDIGKIISATAGKPQITVATAPSMDGYGSGSSSMVKDGLKVTIQTKSPEIVIGDTDLLKTAPIHMAKSGLGDMLAKYVSICEWRLSHIITGEYYCEKIASYIRESLRACVENASGLLEGKDESVEAVFRGLLASGIAMDYAGLSRPASGGEHYLSHIWDIRALAFHTPMDMHGIQCGIATLYVSRAYEALKRRTPDRQHALKSVVDFDYEKWAYELRRFIGRGAEPMIALEKNEKKYDTVLHKARLDRILAKWEEILRVIDEELPPSHEIDSILTKIRAPKTAEEIGIERSTLPTAFKATKDFRDKYVLTRLLWDLGLLDEVCEEIF